MVMQRGGRCVAIESRRLLELGGTVGVLTLEAGLRGKARNGDSTGSLHFIGEYRFFPAVLDIDAVAYSLQRLLAGFCFLVGQNLQVQADKMLPKKPQCLAYRFNHLRWCIRCGWEFLELGPKRKTKVKMLRRHQRPACCENNAPSHR